MRVFCCWIDTALNLPQIYAIAGLEAFIGLVF
jgi:hypothetical protein